MVLDQEPQVFQKETQKALTSLAPLKELLPLAWQSLANVGACCLTCPVACPHLCHAELGGAKINYSSTEAARCCA